MVFLAEFYLSGETSVAELAGRLRTGAEQAARDGRSIRVVQVIFVPQDENCFAVYRAESAADVALAGRVAGLDFDRVVMAQSVP